jgi:hypothetical protein
MPIGSDVVWAGITAQVFASGQRRDQMSKLSSSRIARTVVSVVICTAATLLGFAFRSNNGTAAGRAYRAQRTDDKLVIRHDWGNEPVEFSNFHTKNLVIAPGRKFSAAEAGAEYWLESFAFNLKNVSDKKIVFVLLHLHFPETGVTGSRLVYSLEIGIPPKAMGPPLEYAKPLSVDPGETFTFTLSAKELEDIKSFLELKKYQLVDLNQMDIVLGPVVFDDGMKWEMRSMSRPDPNSPSGYKRIN